MLTLSRSQRDSALMVLNLCQPASSTAAQRLKPSFNLRSLTRLLERTQSTQSLRLFSSRYADVRRNPHSAALQAFENELKADLQAVAQREQLEQARPDSVLTTRFFPLTFYSQEQAVVEREEELQLEQECVVCSHLKSSQSF